jgi:hypothetical protein
MVAARFAAVARNALYSFMPVPSRRTVADGYEYNGYLLARIE